MAIHSPDEWSKIAQDYKEQIEHAKLHWLCRWETLSHTAPAMLDLFFIIIKIFHSIVLLADADVCVLHHDRSGCFMGRITTVPYSPRCEMGVRCRQSN
ncbi:hypothetical protein TNCV_2928431 [Trichonephila clavipes]|nr:hypothetical protein TNCV_2928431 [Trichonephila clavipes]